MAARSGTGRSPTSPSSRPRETMGQASYEEIKPKSIEWQEEKTAHVLNVHLPGFVKDQIRVTYDEKLRSFNVQGDRALGNNRFGRLNVDFTAPANCKMKDMQGKFQGEVLTITIPKEYVPPFFDPKEATTSAQSPEENALISVTHEPPAISETQGKKMKRPNDTDVADFASKEKMRPKNSGLVESKAGEIVGRAEKQLIVNVGVAALVLVAFGSYVGYNFACGRSARD